ncbi:hypothetical protein Scani_25920 [Streptomyces caniferus]|uniref:Uncharacterized protein n=1 Tax=Streptomyces caniferus TaxID=285557 RepID=A0A640S683_9ACTN|nr:hypothetical protein Scani_25920 [Streptomyces caniferus]
MVAQHVRELMGDDVVLVQTARLGLDDDDVEGVRRQPHTAGRLHAQGKRDELDRAASVRAELFRQRGGTAGVGQVQAGRYGVRDPSQVLEVLLAGLSVSPGG